jgi:diaminopropionate ammonia-lyase
VTAPNWVLHTRDRMWRSNEPDRAVAAFHHDLAEYEPTRLVDLPQLAAELGVGRVVAKDESTRLGLPAFKALGASWAVHRCLQRVRHGRAVFVCATDGNHGRAVARFAGAGGHHVIVFTPRGVHPHAIDAIRSEGAEVHGLDVNYDGAVRAAAEHARRNDRILVQDTAWDGYTTVPQWIVDGYDTLFVELDEQLASVGLVADLIVVPTGVGSLLQAAITHYRSGIDPARTRIASAEPNAAACVQSSLRAGHPVPIDTGPTSMAGLCCGTVSSLAWPLIEKGLDAAFTVFDSQCRPAAIDLAAAGVSAGPCGAAPLATLRDALRHPARNELTEHLELGPSSTIVMLVTEGIAANPLPT